VARGEEPLEEDEETPLSPATTTTAAGSRAFLPAPAAESHAAVIAIRSDDQVVLPSPQTPSSVHSQSESPTTGSQENLPVSRKLLASLPGGSQAAMRHLASSRGRPLSNLRPLAASLSTPPGTPQGRPPATPPTDEPTARPTRRQRRE
jgi:hypothetical protein